MRMEEAFYNISMYLYNKNILEYAQIARNEILILKVTLLFIVLLHIPLAGQDDVVVL